MTTLALLGLTSVGCSDSGGNDQRSDPREDTPATTGSDAAPSADPDADAPDPAPSPAPLPDPRGALPIAITTPAPFTNVIRRTGALLTGSATVTEGSLMWAILGSDLRPLAQGRMQATCGAPCSGTFRVRVATATVPIGSYELHVWSPNAADEGPARLHDTLVPITIVEQETKGAPAPDAFPPGGVPQ